MGLIDDALQLLSRPSQREANAAAEAKKPRGAKAAEPWTDEPVTEDALVSALERCAAERMAASLLIEGAGERREALLMKEGTDDEIRDLGTSVDRANLTIERLERIEPDLHRRLRELRNDRRVRRWTELRDAYVRDLEPVFLAMSAYQAVLNAALAKEGALRSEFPSAFQDLRNQGGPPPAMPPMPCLNMTPEHFKAFVMKFAGTGFNPAPKPQRMISRVSDLLEEAQAKGLEAHVPGFGILPTNEPIEVRLKRYWEDEYGTMHKPETTLELPLSIAWPLIQKGAAVRLDR